LEKGIRRRRLNLEKTVESVWALGTINKKEKDELGNGKCVSGLEKEGDEKSDPRIGERRKDKALNFKRQKKGSLEYKN